MAHTPGGRIIGLGVIALVLLMACCGSAAGSTTTASAGTTTSETAAPSERVLSLSTVATELSAAGLGCGDLELNDDDDDAGSSSVPLPEFTSGRCIVQGSEVTITVLPTAADAQLAHELIDVYRPQMAAQGYTRLAWLISGPDGRIWVQVEHEEITPAPTEADLALLDTIAAVLGGTVETVDV